jgi:hypothetical protein
MVSLRTLLFLGGGVTSFGIACTPNFDALSAGLDNSAGGAAGSSAGGGGADCAGHGCAEAGGGSAGAGGDKEQGLAGTNAAGGEVNVAGRAGSVGGASGSNDTAGGGGSNAAGSGGSNAAGSGGSNAAGSGGSNAAGSGGSNAAGSGGSNVAGSGGSAGSGTTDIQLFGTASADSYQQLYGLHVPSDANDGDLTTRWVAADGGLNHWWQLDLGQSHPLSSIEITWEYPAQAAGQSYGYTLGVSGSACPIDFSSTPPVVIDNTKSTETSQVQVAQFPAGTIGRCVRITVTSLPPVVNQMASWASFWEVRVFGQ